MQEFDRQLQQTSLADWKVYLKWQVLNSTAEALIAPVVEEDYAFFGKYLRGQAEMKPRWKRCVESTDQLLGEALGKKYAEEYFPPEAKARAHEMVRNILAAMRDDILSRPWMNALWFRLVARKWRFFQVYARAEVDTHIGSMRLVAIKTLWRLWDVLGDQSVLVM